MQSAVSVESGSYVPATSPAYSQTSLSVSGKLTVNKPTAPRALLRTSQLKLNLVPSSEAHGAANATSESASNVQGVVAVESGSYAPATGSATIGAHPAVLAANEPATSQGFSHITQTTALLAAPASPPPSTTYGSGNATLQSVSNGQGYIAIQSGANVSATGPVTISTSGFPSLANPVSLAVDGNLNINGPAASLNLTSTGHYTTELEVGYSAGSAGTLSITNGGQVNVDTGFVQAGWNQGSTGTITVSGQGSSLTAYGIIVGNGDTTAGNAPASGTLNVLNGASVTADVVALGNCQPATGVINISNATLTENQGLYASGDGSGQININAGGNLIANGTVYLGVASSSPTSDVINLNQGGELDVNGNNGIVAQSGGQGSYAFNLAGGTFKIIGANLTTNANMYLVNNTDSYINTNGYTGTFSGALSGGGGLIKEGSGTLALTGNNTYTGGIAILGGNVQLASSGMSNNVNPLTFLATTTPQGGVSLGQVQTQGAAILSQPLVLALAQPGAGSQYIIGKSYQILTANGGLSGKFSSINLAGAYAQNLNAVAVYSQNSVSVQLQATQATINSGHFYAANGYAQDAALFNTMTTPLQAAQGYWLHGLGSFGHTPGATYNYKGYVVGRGFEVNQHLTLGGGVSNVYTHTGDPMSSHVDGMQIGGQAYGVYTFSNWSVTGTGIMGYIKNKAERYLLDTGNGKFNSSGLYEGASLGAQYAALNLTHIFASPYGSISYLHTHTGSAHESGLGTMNMDYGQINTNLAQIGFGTTFGYKSETSYGNLSEWISLGGTGTLGNTHSRADETIGLQQASVTGQIASPLMATPSVGIELAGNRSPFTLAAMWEGEFANRTSGQQMTIKGSYKF